MLSVVVPVYADWQALARLLGSLEPLLAPALAPLAAECLVVAADEPPAAMTAALSTFVTLVPAGRAGRGQQLAQGAALARGQWLWCLHADSGVTADCVQQLCAVVSTERPGWGRFDVRLVGRHPLLPMVAGLMNARSRYSGIATGDQGIFVHRSLLRRVGGIPPQSLMEDLQLSKQLRRVARPHCLPGPLATSGRRWDQGGLWQTILSMWWYRFRYWLGVDPERLAADYYRVRERPPPEPPEPPEERGSLRDAP